MSLIKSANPCEKLKSPIYRLYGCQIFHFSLKIHHHLERAGPILLRMWRDGNHNPNSLKTRQAVRDLQARPELWEAVHREPTVTGSSLDL